MRDERGTPLRLSAMRGKPVVVTFLYTTCKDTCPLTAQQIRIALDDLGHDVPVVAVSVDPANDTPSRARTFALKQSMAGRMRWALGSAQQLQRLWNAYFVEPQTADSEHTASTILLDARGVQRVGYATSVLTARRISRTTSRCSSARPARARSPAAQTTGGFSAGGRRPGDSPRLTARRSLRDWKVSTPTATSSGATYSRLTAQWPACAIGRITSSPPTAARGRVR